jgi:hypothetical protein
MIDSGLIGPDPLTGEQIEEILASAICEVPVRYIALRHDRTEREVEDVIKRAMADPAGGGA